MDKAPKYCTAVALCASLGVNACSDSTDDPPATQSDTSAALPGSAAGAAGTAGTPAGAAGTTAAAGTTGEAGTAASAAGSAGEGTGTPPASPSAAPSADMATPPTESFPGESCDGCVRFFLPITGENQRGDFELLLAAPVDMTGATLRFRLMTNAFTGNAGGVSVYVRDAGNFDKGFVWTNLSALAAWTEVAVDFTTMLAGNVSFDITRVAKVGVQLNSAGTFAGANWQDATVYLDSVRFSNAPSADLTFDTGIGEFSLVTPDAPAETNVGFIAPGPISQ